MELFKRICVFLMIAAMVILSATYSSAQPNRNSSVVCIDETLNADPTSATCTVFIGDKKRVTLVLNAVMNWTDSDPDLDLDLKIEISSSQAGTFYDVDNIIDSTGVDSPITSPISLALSGADTDTTHENQYYLPIGYTAQYLRITLTATNSDADDTVVADLLVNFQE